MSKYFLAISIERYHEHQNITGQLNFSFTSPKISKPFFIPTPLAFMTGSVSFIKRTFVNIFKISFFDKLSNS